MGIRKKTFKIAVCDECGVELDSAGYGSFTVYDTDDDVREAMVNCGWTLKDGKLHCDSCWEK